MEAVPPRGLTITGSVLSNHQSNSATKPKPRINNSIFTPITSKKTEANESNEETIQTARAHTRKPLVNTSDRNIGLKTARGARKEGVDTKN